MGMTTNTLCPFCGADYVTNRLPAHMDACIDNPDVFEAVREAILSESSDGVAPGNSAYVRMATEMDLPSLTTIRQQISWTDLVHLCGLITSSEASSPSYKRGRVLAEVKRLASVLNYEGTYGPNQTEWEVFSEYRCDRVHKLFGSWEAMLAEAGLTLGPRPYYQARSKERQAQLSKIMEAEFERMERQMLAEEALKRDVPVIDRGVRAIWDWLRHGYVQAHVYELR